MTMAEDDVRSRELVEIDVVTREEGVDEVEPRKGEVESEGVVGVAGGGGGGRSTLLAVLPGGPF